MRHKTSKIYVDDLPVILTRKKMKNIRLSVAPESAEVKVSAPTWASSSEVVVFIKENKKWIEKRRTEILKKVLSVKAKYQNGADHKLWGETVKLNLLENANASLNLADRKAINIVASKDDSDQVIAKKIDVFYREEMLIKVPLLMEKWCNAMGVQINAWSVRKAKTRWGSCNARLKRINLNSELAKYSIGCLEYVIVHELAHLFEGRHNQRFWNIVNQTMPDWRIYHDLLNAHHID